MSDVFDQKKYVYENSIDFIKHLISLSVLSNFNSLTPKQTFNTG